MRPFHRRTSLVLAVVFVGMGLSLIVETAMQGGGIGFLIGVLFIAAGAGRIYLFRRG